MFRTNVFEEYQVKVETNLFTTTIIKIKCTDSMHYASPTEGSSV